jgi:dihydroflavonol-4-reductase
MILVTGANGLVGSFIVRKLLELNIRPRCLKRPESNLKILNDIKDKVEWVEGDILDILSIDRILQGVDTIIHAAAMVSFYPGNFDRMFKVNVEGTANLVNLALKNHVKKFVFVSSVASLGRNKNHLSINESSLWEDAQGTSHYARTKYLSEIEVWRGAEEGLDVIIVNPSVVLGPGDWNKSSTRLFKYVRDENIFYPSGNISYVDVRDIAEIIMKLLEENSINERFILNGGNISYNLFFQKVAAGLNKKAPQIRAIPFIASIAWRLAAVVSRFNGKEPLITRETAMQSKKIYNYENYKIKNVLEYKFREIEDTISWITEELKKKERQCS